MNLEDFLFNQLEDDKPYTANEVSEILRRKCPWIGHEDTVRTCYQLVSTHKCDLIDNLLRKRLTSQVPPVN